MGNAYVCEMCLNCWRNLAWLNATIQSLVRVWWTQRWRLKQRNVAVCSKKLLESGCAGLVARKHCGDWKQPSGTYSALRVLWQSCNRVSAVWNDKPGEPRNMNRGK